MPFSIAMLNYQRVYYLGIVAWALLTRAFHGLLAWSDSTALLLQKIGCHCETATSKNWCLCQTCVFFFCHQITGCFNSSSFLIEHDEYSIFLGWFEPAKDVCFLHLEHARCLKRSAQSGQGVQPLAGTLWPGRYDDVETSAKRNGRSKWCPYLHYISL